MILWIVLINFVFAPLTSPFLSEALIKTPLLLTLGIKYHINQTLAQCNSAYSTVLDIVPRTGTQLKNPAELKSCAQARNEPRVVSRLSHYVFPSRLPEYNITQIYAPKSKAILICVIITVCYGFTCQLSSHPLNFWLKYIVRIPDIVYYTLYTTFENNENCSQQ